MRGNGKPPNGNGNGNGSNGAGDHAVATSVASRATPEIKKKVLVPGTHFHNQDEDYSDTPWPANVSNAQFADAALAALPHDLLLCRSSQTVGRLFGGEGEREFDSVDGSDARLFVDEAVQLVRWGTGENGSRRELNVNCSESLGRLVVRRARFAAEISKLTRLVRYPVYLPGFELSKPGWNGGNFYDPPKDLRRVEPETNQDTIHQILEELVEDFPFMAEGDEGGAAQVGEGDDGDANRQNFYGIMLTAILRPALEGNVPMHLVNAPLERTGKSKLIEEVLGGVLLGKPTPALAMAGTHEEFDKRVLALLTGGRTLIHLDNVSEDMDSAVLASLLTASEYQGRELGKTLMREYVNTLVVVASGNNVGASGEIAKRTIPIHLQPATDRPEDRNGAFDPIRNPLGFRHPELRSYVMSVRPAVLSALLGMVENWKSIGRPAGKRPLGGFEAWARVIGGVMEVNGFKRWMTNAKAWQRGTDQLGDEWTRLAAAWAEKFGDHPVPAKGLFWLAGQCDVFEAVRKGAKTFGGALNKFGRLLTKSGKDRPVGCGMFIRRSTYGNNAAYFLEGAPHQDQIIAEWEMGDAMPP